MVSNNLTATSSTLSDLLTTAATVSSLVATVSTTGDLSLSNPTPALSSYFALPPTRRLTLTSNIPVTTSDVTAATTIYYCPYKGNVLSLYDGTKWVMYSYSQLSLSLSGFTASTCYDIFVYNNSGTLTLVAVQWTNSTTRTVSLSVVDGMNVSSLNNTRLYLGTIYMSATGQTQDAQSGRYVWNMYNRVRKSMPKVLFQTTWTYASSTQRPANGDTTNALFMVVGVVEDTLSATIDVGTSSGNTSGSSGLVGFGMNNTTGLVENPQSVAQTYPSTSVWIWFSVKFGGYPGVAGYNFLTWIESSPSNISISFGNAGGLQGQSAIIGDLLF